MVPPEAETGVPPAARPGPRALRLRRAAPARSAAASRGCPRTSAVSQQPLAYRLRFLLWYVPLPAALRRPGRSTAIPAAAIPTRPPPPMVPPLPRVGVGPVTPDAFGKAERTLTAADFPLERVAGGELQLLTAPADRRRPPATSSSTAGWATCAAPETRPPRRPPRRPAISTEAV